MPSDLKDLHLVVRAAGERTTRAATNLARAQLASADDISVVQEVPFEAALRASYLAGLRSGKKWMMTLDSDVLLRPGAIVDLLAEAERLPPYYAQVEGRVFDNLAGLLRPAGQRIYRTELLKVAIGLIPEPGAEIRPEHAVLQDMSRRGHPSHCAESVMGLHDFEQSYRDLYRKSVVHARKMVDFFLIDIIKRALERRDCDPDFAVVLRGLCDGLQYRGPISIDRRQFADMTARALNELGLEEKPAIVDEKGFIEAFPQMWRKVHADYTAPSSALMDEPVLPPHPNGRRSWRSKVRQRIADNGPVRGLLASLGGALRRCGRALEPQR
jgi:hypothetical protein